MKKEENNIISFLDATPYANKSEENYILFELLKLCKILQTSLNEEINMPELQCPALQFEVCKDSQGYLSVNLTANNKHYELEDIVKQVNIVKDHMAKNDQELSEIISKNLDTILAFRSKRDAKYITMPLYIGKENAVYPLN